MKFERAILQAKDLFSGNLLDANDVFSNPKDSFDLRTQYNGNNLNLECVECGQKLNVSTSKFDNVHFKHSPKSGNCILKENIYETEDLKLIRNIHRAKESDRHIYLKNYIGEKLNITNGVKRGSIHIDDRFIILNGEKRKPDVYCVYKDKEIVFEIQLSQLPLSYILSRYNFYKNNQMYLIWILDNFDVRNQKGQLERDIKYLTEYQNFFRVDENSENELLLECEFKQPYMDKFGSVYSKWFKKSVTLDSLKFPLKNFQVFFYDFKKQTRLIEEKSKDYFKRKEEAEKLSESKLKVRHFINLIKKLKSNNTYNYDLAHSYINELNYEELKILNSSIKLSLEKKETRTPKFIFYFKYALEGDLGFLKFLLECQGLRIDFNKNDENGVSLFEIIHLNKKINNKALLIRALFGRGYLFKERDKHFVSKIYTDDIEKEKELILLNWYQKLKNINFIELAFQKSSFLYILESINQRRIIGSKLNNWIAFANNAIQHYKEYWILIEKSFQINSLWEIILKNDKKGSFTAKLGKLKTNLIEQDKSIDRIVKILYPELF